MFKTVFFTLLTNLFQITDYSDAYFDENRSVISNINNIVELRINGICSDTEYLKNNVEFDISIILFVINLFTNNKHDCFPVITNHYVTL